eukprot:4388198-Alexandrium_andersonii.AAC.1
MAPKRQRDQSTGGAGKSDDAKSHNNAMNRFRYQLGKAKKEVRKEFKKLKRNSDKKGFREKFERTGSFDFVVTSKRETRATLWKS